VGSQKLDDGVAIFFLADDRKVRIEVGYGLEPILTDARASTIIRDDVVPRLRTGDRDGAVSAAVDCVLAALGPTAGAVPEGEGEAAKGPGSQIAAVVGIIVVLLLLGLASRNPALAAYLMYTMASGRRRGGWGGGWGGGFGGGGFGGGGRGGFSGGGGRGGFSGGGGRSGGGGASGSW
jgi:uncharacterized protein